MNKCDQLYRYKLVLEYDGSVFHGWQYQKGVITVQSVVDGAIAKFIAKEGPLGVAGRTDAGVHAKGQVIHFDSHKLMEPFKVLMALNHHLQPFPVSVLSVELVDLEFHARFSAKYRRYEYYIRNRKAPLTFENNKVWRVGNPLNVALMQQAADYLVGTHDFSTFRDSECQASSPIKTVDFARFIEREDGLIIFEIQSKSFLHHQVRNIIGTLVNVGSEKWGLSRFLEAFEAKDRTKGGPTASPYGLYLVEVGY